MVSRPGVVLSLVLVVLLAGCAGLTGGDGGGTGDADIDAPSDVDYPNGYAETGIEDGERAVEAHTEQLVAAGTFTVDYRYDVDLSDSWTTVDVGYQVETENERAFQQAAVSSPERNVSTETYTEGDTQHQRSAVEDRHSDVSVSETEFDVEALTATEIIEPLLVNASYGEASLDERDGETVLVYEADDADTDDDFLGVENPDDVTSFESTLVVTPDGLILDASFRLEYLQDDEERVVEMTFGVSELGTTSVDRPDWADDA